VRAGAGSLAPLLAAARHDRRDLTLADFSAEQIQWAVAMEEIVGHVERHVPPLTLLKGISLCEQHYPEPHLRTTGDIDALVDAAAVPELEARLVGLGYRPRSTYPREFYEHHRYVVAGRPSIGW
jgi:hypothetical protein